MTCDKCGKEASSFHGEPRRTVDGTNLVSQHHYCYDCFQELYGEGEELDRAVEADAFPNK
jgi:hypothetical protein